MRQHLHIVLKQLTFYSGKLYKVWDNWNVESAASFINVTTLKMEAISSSEMQVTIPKTIRRDIT